MILINLLSWVFHTFHNIFEKFYKICKFTQYYCVKHYKASGGLHKQKMLVSENLNELGIPQPHYTHTHTHIGHDVGWLSDDGILM